MDPAQAEAIDAFLARLDTHLACGDGAVMSVLRQVRLLRARERFIGRKPGQLGIKSLKQMAAVTDAQLKEAGFKAVTRRKFLAAMKSLH